MHRKNLPLIALIVFLLATISYANAETVFERSFSEMGYEKFEMDSPESTGCTSIDFIFPSDVNAFAGKNYPIVSLNVEFLPVKSEAANIDVNLNGTELKRIKSTEFKCPEEECWARIALQKELLKKTKNTFNICLNTSNTTTKIVLKVNSKIGVYHTADFSDFTTVSEKQELVIGDTTKIKVIIHNQGSDFANVEIKYARPIAEEKKAFAFVGGKAFGSGNLAPDQTIVLEYTIKPRVIGPITLPPAAAYFNNEFGEQETIFSSLATINVREPEKKIDAFIGKEKEINLLGEKAKIQLNVKNNGRDPVYNLSVALKIPQELSLDNADETIIGFIAPGETKSIQYLASASSTGNFDIGCKITYVDLNETESKCENSKLIFEQPSISIGIIAAIILAIIGVLVYVYIMKSK